LITVISQAFYRCGITASLLLGLVLLWLPQTQADSTEQQYQVNPAEQQLQAFFDGLRTLTATFEQQVNDADGALIQKSQGHLWLQRPGRFRWDYLQPYHQLIVSDGQQIWVYDEDLEQVTVQAFDATISQTPASLLSSDKPILDSFVVTLLGEREGILWLHLLPRGQDTAFDEMRLGLQAGKLRFMDLRDGLGHTTILSFTEVKRNTSVDPQLFTFVPPAGVDVVRDTGQGFGAHDE
jgi:outer membrane lipoprotein carrier protein